MLSRLKDSWKLLTCQKCLFCGKVNNQDSFKAEVKIPGWKDEREKYFCSAACLEAWKNYAKERGKIKCSSCCCGK
jgi:hypothetical protein